MVRCGLERGWCAGRNPSLALVISVFVVCLLLEIGGVIFVSLCILTLAILFSVCMHALCTLRFLFLVPYIACEFLLSLLSILFDARMHARSK